MPLKDKEARLAYQRKWYAAHADRVKAKTKARKYNEYQGTCIICGGPTVGFNGPGSASDYCGKPACKSAQHKANVEVFRAAGLKGIKKTKNYKKHELRKQKIVSMDDLWKVY